MLALRQGDPMTSVADTPYLTPAQVAELLQVSTKTVSRWSLEDASMPVTRLPGRVVRFERSALLRWLERRKNHARNHASAPSQKATM